MATVVRWEGVVQERHLCSLFEAWNAATTPWLSRLAERAALGVALIGITVVMMVPFA